MRPKLQKRWVKLRSSALFLSHTFLTNLLLQHSNKQIQISYFFFFPAVECLIVYTLWCLLVSSKMLRESWCKIVGQLYFPFVSL